MSFRRTWNLTRDEESSNGHTQLNMPDPPELISTPSEPSSLFNTQGDTPEDRETDLIEGQVCFGMLVHEKVKLIHKKEYVCKKVANLQKDGITHQVFLIQPATNGELFLMFPDSTHLGYLSKRMKETLEPLLGLPLIELEVHNALNPIMNALKNAQTPSEAAFRVNIHVYGPESHKYQSGGRMSRGKLFLQHPDQCRPGIRYVNPHILRFDDMEDSDVDDEMSAAGDESDVEMSFDSDENFDETIAIVFQSLRQPRELNPARNIGDLDGSLYPHQEQALDFMIQRETGEITAQYRLWQKIKNDAAGVFSHVITHDRQESRPDESGGGILADEMGMGKSLTTLVLIRITAGDAREWAARSSTLPKTSLAGIPCRATLVIVPQKWLVEIWVREIENRLKGTLKVMVYHGRNRKKLLVDVDDYDIVMTTYNTLAKEHDDKLLGKGKSPLHEFLWYRVVLDEAHVIRRCETTFHKAASNLEAKTRWCLSGTPIQNSLTDLAALLAFLKIRPFHETRIFRHWIGRPFEERETRQRAIQRLTTLLTAICIRRTTDQIKIPGKKEQIRVLQFSPEERAQYDRIFSAMKRFMMQQTGEYNPQTAFGIFQVIIQLRSFCNHGTYQHELSWMPGDLLEDEIDPVLSISRDSRHRCLVCREKLPIRPRHDSTNPARNCKHILCDECAKRRNEADTTGKLQCALCETLRASNPDGSRQMGESISRSTGRSSKIRALVDDIQGDLQQTKSIVFSCWTRTLDLISRHFTDAGIPFQRIDGKTKTVHRQEILDSFNETSQIPVLIMTTGTGAFGLNIQSANRVFIVEPQWNPSVEDQAISRAIRLGQEQQVRVIRYRMEDSIEEDMCMQQAHKLTISKMDFRKDST